MIAESAGGAPAADPQALTGPDRRRPGDLPATAVPVPAAAAVLTGRPAAAFPELRCGVITEDAGRVLLRDLGSKATFPWNGPALAPGTVVEAELSAGKPAEARLVRALAEPNTSLAAMYGIAGQHHLDPTFSPAVRAETQALLAAPGIDDPSLRDFTHLPFVTIDNLDSRDLDQALHIERNPVTFGLDLYYALADASYYVRPGSALFAEATRRGSSYYLPGLTIPMLPKELSEGLVSLNEGVDRRAMVFKISLDQTGQVLDTEVCRGRIHSRAKLTYDGVQDFHDHRPGHTLAGKPFSESLLLMRELGELRLQDAAARDVVQIIRTPVEVKLDGRREVFELVADERNDVERWNEQISLLTNIEGALLLMGEQGKNLGAPNLQSIFRSHRSPSDQSLQELASFVDALVTRRGLDPKTWQWRRAAGEPLADYLERLPRGGDAGRLTRAIHRRAMIINVRSEFEADPSPHHGIGAAAYARFSSPMREMVGIFTHKEAYELLDGLAHAAPTHDDEVLRAAVIESGNRSRVKQKEITNAANRLAIDALFDGELSRPVEERPVRRGTVMGVSGSKVYVQLDDPPIEVKLYLAPMQQRSGVSYTVDPRELEARGSDGRVLGVGQAIDLRVAERDGAHDQWLFDLVG